MPHGAPRDHHYVPQFYLRQFASDPAAQKIRTVMRAGDYAIYAERSIKTLGYERDFYVHHRGGIPVNVEVAIGKHVETPLSQSETWQKIVSGHGHQLDTSDRSVLYTLIRHLESRNLHAQKITAELVEMAADPASDIPFTAEEREMYAFYRRNPNALRRMMNFRAVRNDWTERDFRGSSVTVLRSPIQLRTSTTPVLTLDVARHPALRLPLPGQTPYIYVLALNRATLAMLVLGDFDGAFSNIEIPAEAAMSINRHHVGYFTRFKHVRHVIADDDRLLEDMRWAQFELIYSRERDMKFRLPAPTQTGHQARSAMPK